MNGVILLECSGYWVKLKDSSNSLHHIHTYMYVHTVCTVVYLVKLLGQQIFITSMASWPLLADSYDKNTDLAMKLES